MATAAENLAALEAALDELAKGQMVASTEYDGVKVAYSKADMPTLRLRIRELKAEVNGTTFKRSAIGVTF